MYQPAPSAAAPSVTARVAMNRAALGVSPPRSVVVMVWLPVLVGAATRVTATVTLIYSSVTSPQICLSLSPIQARSPPPASYGSYADCGTGLAASARASDCRYAGCLYSDMRIAKQPIADRPPVPPSHACPA